MDRRYIPGDRWVRCDECGFGYRYSQIRKGVSLRQKGYHVCPDCFDPRHPNTDWRLPPKKEGVLIGGNIGANEGTSTTDTNPVVSLQWVVDTKAGSGAANSSSTILRLGSEDISQHGVCYAESSSPTTSDTKTTQGTKTTEGIFTSDLPVLAANTLFYVRAYATTSVGTVYSNEVTITLVY